MDLLNVDTNNGLDFNMAKKAEEQARLSMQSVKTANRLNTLAAIFFPLMAITSVFGMNLRSGLEEASIVVFWFVLLVGILLGFVIHAWVLEDLGAKREC